LIQLGRADGIRAFGGDVLATNAPMLSLLRKVAPGCRSTLAEGVCHVEFDLAEDQDGKLEIADFQFSILND
jgi:hypothetical protein